MRSRVVLSVIFILVGVGTAACRPDRSDEVGISVVASFYPLAEAAERVGGDLARVENLVPPGVEAHDVELTPNDLARIQGADLVVYLGAGFQPAVEDAVAEAGGRTLDVLTVVPTLRAEEHVDAHEQEEHVDAHEGEEHVDAHEGEVDPHVWLDPMRFARIVRSIAGALADLDPVNREAYVANAGAYVDELRALDEAYRAGLAACRSRVLVTSHAAFGYLADAYGLRQESIAGLSPEAEPTPSRLAELRALVQAEGVTTVFAEELVSPKVAQTLAEEAGIRTAVLSPLEGPTQEQLEAGEDYDYVSIMHRNLRVLKAALGCS